ncbi:MAG TPA: hypothetical protein PLP27_06755, partial [Crocinitomicaceae bacterium]|nr:hypothetical protein [Crocinitomicaceae bacterium]
LVSVQDASSTTCSNPQAGTATVIVNRLPIASVLPNNLVHNCIVGGSAGSANITVIDGTPTYTYSIDNGVSFSSVNPITGLLSNNYTVIVHDVNGCADTATFQIDDPAGGTVLSATIP